MVLLGSGEDKDGPSAVLQVEADIILLDHASSSHTPIKVGGPDVHSVCPRSVFKAACGCHEARLATR
jgi:hypothetical protein